MRLDFVFGYKVSDVKVEASSTTRWQLMKQTTDDWENTVAGMSMRADWFQGHSQDIFALLNEKNIHWLINN